MCVMESGQCLVKNFPVNGAKKVGAKITLFIVPFIYFLSVHFSCDVSTKLVV